MEITNTNWHSMSDAAILKQIGQVLKQLRLQQNITQAQMATESGLNRYTVAQIEKGEGTSLVTLLKVLRVLNAFHLLDTFQLQDEISPMAYIKMQKKQRKRASGGNQLNEPDTDLGW